MLRPATKFAPRTNSEFQLAWDAGFRNAEFWLDLDLIRDWEARALIASEFPMQYALHFPNRGEFSMSDLRQAVNFYRALNCSAMVIHQPMFDRYGEQLFEIDSELRLGIENHDLTSDSQFERWAEESRWLTLDVEHLWIYTAGDSSLKKLMKYMDRFLAKYGDKLVHVHLPGYQPGYKVHRPQYCSRKMVLQVFNMLADANFTGLIVSETANRYQNLEELQMDVLLHRHWMNTRRLAGEKVKEGSKKAPANDLADSDRKLIKA